MLIIALVGYSCVAIKAMSDGGISSIIGIATLVIVNKFWDEIKAIKVKYK